MNDWVPPETRLAKGKSSVAADGDSNFNYTITFKLNFTDLNDLLHEGKKI